MWFIKMFESALLFVLMKLQQHIPESNPSSTAKKKVSEPEPKEKEETFGSLERLTRIEAQLHYFGHVLEVLVKAQKDSIKRLDAQTLLIEEMLYIFESAFAQVEQQPKENPIPDVKVSASIQQKSKKQILN